MNAPTRPVLRYHGGKWRLAPWIVGHFPPHRIYVEPFGGAASVLIRKPATFTEVYNDLDDRLVNVFRVLRDPVKSEQLRKMLELTPFARAEFDAAYGTDPVDDVEAARRTVVTSFMGFGSDSVGRGYRTGFRAKSNRSNTTPAHDWASFPVQVRRFHERLRTVVIEKQDAVDVMRRHDAPNALHYVDPPYVHETRSAAASRHGYRYELTDQQHRDLAAVLHSLDGMVVLSGYQCPLYEELFGDWQREDVVALADGAKERVECLWLNPACAAAQRQQKLPMGV